MSPSKRRALLVEKRISQVEIADALGVTTPAVSIVLSGRSRSYRIEKAISDRAGVSYDEMWGSKPRKRAA